MDKEYSIEARTKGKLPLSIATSLAIEGLFGMIDDKPDIKPQWEGFTHLLVNARTLFRNVIGSFSKEVLETLNPGDFSEIIIEEMSIIRSAVSVYSKNRIETLFYVCSYNSLTNFYPFAYFKEAKTAIQTHTAAVENSTIDNIFKTLGDQNSFIKRYDVNITPEVTNTLVITHFPFDLLQIKKAKDIALLESHTGVVKKRYQWNTKLKNAGSLPPMPFDIMTVQLFGDSGNLFNPYPKPIRDKVIGIAKQYEWHQQTTRARIMQTIQLAHDPNLVLMIRRLYL